ncbi:MAG: xanthine dehydrogenase [Rhodospirillaceae bacterium]|nr:xanthine dehydrogenase [Rhodospirillaceae bacterium]|tara:strand:- start:55 stop:777 length:723 start_codon:yes stop_codon:yes gene_type:complete
MKRAHLDALLADRAAKRPVVLATRIEDGRQVLIHPDRAATDGDDAVVAAARQALKEDKSQLVEIGGSSIFLHVFNPPLRMIIVGAVHIAQPLSAMAALAGYSVTIVDPRGAFATEERFPGVEINTEWPDDAMKALAPDSRTAVVTLTHDPKLDDAALEVALKSDAFYIGSLGSKKTHTARRNRMGRLGFDEATVDRIHGPVGLPLGGRSPAEVATSILAQVIAVRHADGKIERPALEVVR